MASELRENGTYKAIERTFYGLAKAVVPHPLSAGALLRSFAGARAAGAQSDARLPHSFSMFRS